MRLLASLLLAVLMHPQEPAAAPTPAESPFQASSDIGYRALAGQHGSFNTYRSIVNLGEGPRLLQFQTTYKPPSFAFLDELRLHGANWGDPLNTFLLNAEKSALYRATFSYRNLAYFNALPSFASPQLAKLGPEAYTTNQRATDTRQRFWNADFDFLPGRRWTPFFGVAQNTGLGSGVSPFVLDENSYPAASRIDYGYTVVRGGLRLELEKLHLSLEQGGARFRDESSLVNTLRNTGNRESTYFGRPLLIDRATQLYDVNGGHIYSSADLTLSPLAWLDISAEFYYSRPRSEVTFNESAQGTILRLDTLRFVNGQQSLATGYASQPRTAGGLTLEVRPLARLRVLDSWQIERTHNAGSLFLQSTVDARSLPPVNSNDRLIWRQNEQRLQVFYDFSKRFTLFGGHRFLWGDSEVRRASLAPGPVLEGAALRRHSALGGFVFRPTTKLTFNAETEVGRGDQTYFRTSLQNFEQLRLRARYQISDSWQLNSRFVRLNNSNPTLGVGLDFRSQQSNLTLQWTRKAFSVMADYTRSTIFSDLTYLDPVGYDPERSLYRDNAHTGTLAADLRLPRHSLLTLGGSVFRSSGSRPSRYYQPLGRLRIPLHSQLGFLAEWRNISYGQSLFAYEAFGVQQITVGLHLGR